MLAVSGLEKHITPPVPREMGMQTYDEVEARVKTLPEYTGLFHQAFGSEAVSIDNIARAIACFERTLLSANSPFDRFISGGQSTLSETQKQGWLLFRGKARCTACHEFQLSFPFFTDFKFHNTGIAMGAGNLERLVADAKALMAQNSEKPTNPKNVYHSSPKTDRFGELGRFVESGQQSDIGAFKTPSLRDVELTAPYMHDGSIRTLLDVVRFYNLGGKPNPYLDQEIRPLNLSDQEMNALVEFLRSLTSDDVLRMVQSSQPQNRAPDSIRNKLTFGSKGIGALCFMHIERNRGEQETQNLYGKD